MHADMEVTLLICFQLPYTPSHYAENKKKGTTANEFKISFTCTALSIMV